MSFCPPFSMKNSQQRAHKSEIILCVCVCRLVSSSQARARESSECNAVVASYHLICIAMTCSDDWKYDLFGWKNVFFKKSHFRTSLLELHRVVVTLVSALPAYNICRIAPNKNFKYKHNTWYTHKNLLRIYFTPLYHININGKWLSIMLEHIAPRNHGIRIGVCERCERKPI